MGKDVSYDIDSVSAGVKYLTQGYIDYASTVISGRALPDYRDGLKPVNRRIVYTLLNMQGAKNNPFRKGVKVSGDTLALHPHGEGSVYMAAVLMTDENGSLAFPLLKGQGSFGHVYSNAKPAAMRYTEMKLHDNVNEIIGEMNGIKLVPNFDATTTEPEVLPAKFPMVLVNSTSGIAVGFKSNIPSFNFVDICNLVKEFIADGSCHTVIYPDFVTGGYYVYDEKEITRIMKHGSGRLKIRGKYEINNKEIEIREAPFGKNIEGILKQLNTKDSDAIRTAYITDDFASGVLITIDCKTKNRVGEAVYDLLNCTDFQYSYSADITVVDGTVPKRMGVWELIGKWVEWRRDVLTKDVQIRLDAAKQSIREANAFMNVVNSGKRCDELVSTVRSKGKAAGREYVKNNYTREEVPEDLIAFVSSRSLPDYNDGGKYATEVSAKSASISKYEGYLSNIDQLISEQMDELIKEYGAKYARKTEVVFNDELGKQAEDNAEEKKKVVKVQDSSPCVYDLKNGFLRKLRAPVQDSKIEYTVYGKTDDTLLMLDNRGRVLRCYCSDLPFNSSSELGMYLPNYFELKESDDYKITWMGILDGSTLMLLYKDGNVGFIDETEWVGTNRSQRVLQRGIAESCADKLGAVINISEIPDINDRWLYVTDEKGGIAYRQIGTIKRKDRTAKTRAFTLRGDNIPIDMYNIIDSVKNIGYLLRSSNYGDRLKPLTMSDFKGEQSEFINMM